MSSDPLPVVLAADAGFVMQLGVSVASMARCHASGDVRIVVLTDGISAADRAKVDSVSGSLDVEWVEVAGASMAGLRLPDWLPIASAFRIIGIDRLPADTSRFVYLDADTVVCAPLTPLASVDTRQAAVAAVPDAYTPWAEMVPDYPWKAAGFPPALPYFNAGVMLVDCPAWREHGVTQAALAALREQQLAYGDQCALNFALGGRWTRLDLGYNAQAHVFCDAKRPVLEMVFPEGELDAARREPKVLHFNGGFCGRPWAACTHPLQQRWHEARRDTPWESWSPEMSGRGRAGGALRRLKRAASVLRHG